MLVHGGFSYVSQTSENNSNSSWEKIIGIQKLTGKVRKESSLVLAFHET